MSWLAFWFVNVLELGWKHPQMIGNFNYEISVNDIWYDHYVEPRTFEKCDIFNHQGSQDE